jgi:hypothetical protein
MPVRLSVRPSEWNNSAPTAKIFMKYDISVFIFLGNLLRKLNFKCNLTKRSGNFKEDQITFLINSRQILFIVKTFSEIICRENLNTHFVSNFFVFVFVFETSPCLRFVGKSSTAGQTTSDIMAHGQVMVDT